MVELPRGEAVSLLRRLADRRNDLFSDERTWSSSGEPWASSARSQELGYRQALEELAKEFGLKLEWP